MRELLSLEQYLAEVLALVGPDHRSEVVSLREALGRVLAGPVSSRVPVPAFDNSAMDGYAVRRADLAEVPARLLVVGDVAAGSPANPTVGPGECVRIMTGAAVPDFADAVVPVEDTDAGTQLVTINRAPAAGAHIRRAGEAFTAGFPLAEPGEELGAGLASALAAAGVATVAVRPRPLVAVGVTGDELAVAPAPLARGQIYESNSVALAGALTRDGAVALVGKPVSDQVADLRAWLDRAAARADLVVLTGGASVGAYDVVRDVLTEAGGVFRHVRMQPGKPQGHGVWAGKPVLALPGNPISAALSYEVFVRPMLDLLLGRATPPEWTAVAGAAWTSPAGRRQLLPVRLATDAAGRLVATPAHQRGSASHVVNSLAGADGFALVVEDVTSVAAGDLVTVRRW